MVLDTHGHDTHTPMQLMPEPYTYAADTDAVCGILDAHAADTDTMSGILDAHSADTMNQMPMQPILIPCPASSMLMQPMP